ncbi:GFA family protein [Roseimicrobium sp. ORNL1]|uniref:GFA family protein n=1 Tax=Roseimicrobium sp. ORNL1 TaxID=2711231 RepID=UPI0013E18F86|nr:GFA family protein [Roseimicrobium sp. ORNL1]QIF03380.1 GFA family protein [Roseimicrobium sp. ORNL1]
MSTSSCTGGCLCGAIRYEGTGTPYNITHCHCLDCRRANAAPMVTWASFGIDDFRFIQGSPKKVHWAGRIRSFCPECGTQLAFLSSALATEVDVTVCSMDNPEFITPADQTWVEDRLPWLHTVDGLPTYPRERSSHTKP